MSLRWLIAMALLLAASLVSASPLRAADCGVTGSTSQSIGNYNPFVGGISQANARVNLTRRTSSNGQTRRVNFVFLRSANAPAGLDIRYQGASVLVNSAAGVRLSVNSPPAGTVFRDFGGAGQTNTISIDFVVTLPPGLDLRTGQSLTFDILYVCSAQGGMDDVDTPTVLPQVITLRLNVLSALQASYAGPALNFGEIGGVTAADASGHVVTGQMRVASSGPYFVAMTSANRYRMTYPGGDLSNPDETVRYFATLLGQTRSNSSPTFSTVYCAAAGIAGETIPLSVRLQDGGEDKVPSPGYRDVLTITVTPTVTLFWPPATDC